MDSWRLKGKSPKITIDPLEASYDTRETNLDESAKLSVKQQYTVFN